MMRFVALMVFSAAAFFCSNASAANQTIQKAIDGFMRPAYAGFAASTHTLEGALAGLCTAPDKANLDKARHEFGQTITRWGEIENIRFGPITEQSRLDRMLYWPDRKGLGLKQVQAVIAGSDPSFEDAASFPQKSIAVQGLGALEFVLYGTGADDLVTQAGAHRCKYGRAIAQNLNAIAGEVAAGWAAPDGFAKGWANPGKDNPLYRDDAEAMTELFKIFVHGLEQLRDTRLNAFLGQTAESDKPKQAIFWRSNHTVALLDANMQGLKALFDASGLAALATEENAYIGNSIDLEFTNAGRALADVHPIPIAEALKNAQARAKFDYFRIVTSSLSDLFGTRLSAALGLSAGFSSLDGD